MIDMFARPLGALLKMIYNMVVGAGMDFESLSAYAIAIFIATIIVRLIILPLTLKQTKSMQNMQKIQPKLKELQEKYKNDKEKLNAKTMELYKEHKVNPFGGCLPLIIQFPIIIGFFNVLRQPVNYVFKDPNVYESVNRSFFWIKNLENPDLWILPILAGITTYFSSKMMNNQSAGQSEKAQSTQRMMTIMMPLMILWFSRNFPAGLALYWVVGNVFQIVQQYFVNRSKGQVKEESN